VNAAWNGDPSSLVAGMVFEVTEAELAEADRYEVPFGYVRVEAELKSGGRAWVYVAKLRGPEGT
jgi:gamma-glutamylcyclotransferase (GGCT)/AIG2-like uncharacterized protein YtfP